MLMVTIWYVRYKTIVWRLQTTQPTSGGAVTADQADVQIVLNLPAPSNGGPIYRFLGIAAMRTCWMAGAAAHKNG